MGSTIKFAAGLRVGLTALLGVAVGLSAVSGCGPERSLPGVETTATEPATSNASNVVPTSSEKSARDVVDRAIRAMTGGRPERLAQTRVNKSTATGSLYRPVNNQFQFVKTKRQVQTTYPDRIRVEYEFDGGERLTIGLKRPAGVWVRDANGTQPVPNPEQLAEVVSVDALGTYWMVTLTPLAEPTTIVYGFTSASSGGRPIDTIKASVPGYPVVFNLSFDQEKALLKRIEFTHLEAGAAVPKFVVLDEYKAFGGLMLPSKIEYTRNHQVAEQWTVEAWEFPDRIDDAVFEQPK